MIKRHKNMLPSSLSLGKMRMCFSHASLTRCLMLSHLLKQSVNEVFQLKSDLKSLLLKYKNICWNMRGLKSKLREGFPNWGHLVSVELIQQILVTHRLLSWAHICPHEAWAGLWLRNVLVSWSRKLRLIRSELRSCSLAWAWEVRCLKAFRCTRQRACFVAEVSSCLWAAPTLPSHLLVTDTDAMHHTTRLLVVWGEQVLSAVRE